MKDRKGTLSHVITRNCNMHKSCLKRLHCPSTWEQLQGIHRPTYSLTTLTMGKDCIVSENDYMRAYRSASMWTLYVCGFECFTAHSVISSLCSIQQLNSSCPKTLESHQLLAQLSRLWFTNRTENEPRAKWAFSRLVWSTHHTCSQRLPECTLQCSQQSSTRWFSSCVRNTTKIKHLQWDYCSWGNTKN